MTDSSPRAPSTPSYVEEGTAFARLAADDRDEPTRRPAVARRERYDVIVVGGGQAGLAVGQQLARRGLRFVILDASARVGDAWRGRWDSLRLFTPARFDSLPGMPFPAAPNDFPTKDEMADYLEAYAARFELPVRNGTRVERLWRAGDRYRVRAGDAELEADHVVVAMAGYQRPHVPAFARELDPDIVQVHAGEYRHPSQLKAGDVLVVGAGNSGAEIAKELAADHRVWIAGRSTGRIPFRIAGLAGRLLLTWLVLRVIFHRILTVRTPIGRKLRPKVLHHGGPLIRTQLHHLRALGVEHLGRVGGVRDGRPVLEDGRVLDVANVVWCTGFRPGFSWIDLPVFEGEHGDPRHDSGVVPGEPGLYFVGLHFLHSMSSVMVHGVGRDAARIAGTIAERVRARAEARPGNIPAAARVS